MVTKTSAFWLCLLTFSLCIACEQAHYGAQAYVGENWSTSARGVAVGAKSSGGSLCSSSLARVTQRWACSQATLCICDFVFLHFHQVEERKIYWTVRNQIQRFFQPFDQLILIVACFFTRQWIPFLPCILATRFSRGRKIIKSHHSSKIAHSNRKTWTITRSGVLVKKKNQELLPNSWKLDGHIFFKLCLGDLDEKTTSVSYKRERNINQSR